jgi:transcription elongation GreA/GreB family factor
MDETVPGLWTMDYGPWTMNTSLKEKLLTLCVQHVDEKIRAATEAMRNAQQAANEESKSSAGDKYETGRAMMQIERDKAATQLDEALKLKKTLSLIGASGSHRVSLGCIVITKTFNAFIGVGPGKLTVDGIDYFVVTPMSPLGKTLSGLEVGTEFTFNNKPNCVLEIF